MLGVSKLSVCSIHHSNQFGDFYTPLQKLYQNSRFFFHYKQLNALRVVVLIEYDIYFMDSTKLFYCYRINVKSIQTGAEFGMHQLKKICYFPVKFYLNIVERRIFKFLLNKQ